MFFIGRGLYYGLDAANVSILSPAFNMDVTLYTPQTKNRIRVRRDFIFLSFGEKS